MMTRTRRFLEDQGGAVAITYALALTALVAIGGVGFDYARMATMDSELQSGADEAALAAATQLDGTANSINRAVAQASGLVTNATILANDGNADASNVKVANVTFYQTKANAEANTGGFTDNAQSTNAHFVRVSVNARKAYYAFTPIVGALTSGNIDAAATAGMGSAVCRVPPVMMCNPNVNPAIFDVNAFVGKGLLLKASGGGAISSGNFGFLDVGSGASDLAKLMGWANPPGDCVDVTSPSTKPGNMVSVINEFNTRFDIYDGGDSINCYSGSLCPPSDNSRKDVVQAGALTTGSTLAKITCGLSTTSGKNVKGWQVSPDPYRPTSAQTCAAQKCSALGLQQYPDIMGFPRDITHAWHDPTNFTRLGDGVWDINAYWRTNYGSPYASQVGASPSRYAVYKWERANAAGSRQFVSSAGDKYTTFKAAMCRAGASPAATMPDRRVLPVAVVNCAGGLNGSQTVTPLDWVDVFLVEPSLNRGKGSTSYTSKGDIYVEVIGRTGQGTGGTASQYVRRDKPYLIN